MHTKVLSLLDTYKVRELTLKNLRPYFRDVRLVIDHILATAGSLDGITLYPVDYLQNTPWNNELIFNGGMALDLHYGKPARIFTPLGSVRFVNGSSGDPAPLLERLTLDLGLELFMEKPFDVFDPNGPTYHITRTPAGTLIPRAILHQGQHDLDDTIRPRDKEQHPALEGMFASSKRRTRRSQHVPTKREHLWHALITS